MKVHHRFYLISILISVVLLCGKPTNGQLAPISEQSLEALNNYMRYSNKVSYACFLMFKDFEQLNKQFFLFVTDSIDQLSFDRKDLLTNKDFFAVLPRDLYAKTLQDNRYLPYQKRGSPLQLIGQINNVLNEISSSRKALDEYINTAAYRSDSNLVQGFGRLRRIEVLYYDIFTLQEKLHWNLSALLSTFALVNTPQLSLIERLQQILKQTKLLIKSVRANDNSSLLHAHRRELSVLLGSIKFSEAQHKNLNKQQQKACYLILDKSKQCLEQSHGFSRQTEYTNRKHLPHYYYYNQRLLPCFNRLDNGMAVLFNQLIETQQITWLLEQEMPPMFEVIYPKLPVFEAYQTPDIDIDQLIQKALLAKARKDSLHQWQEQQIQLALQDSLDAVQQQVDPKKPLSQKPQRGDPNLRGFASNNLVFLLDISASMSDSNKLPLLKTALRQLLDLMRPEDNITFITYSGRAKVVLEPTSAQYKKNILKAIENLQSGGISDADEGIQLAYKTIQKNWIDAGNNRIILATDGAFNVKKSTKKLILKGSKEKENICLSVFYFSQKEYPHHKELLVELSENGRGKYSYIQKENAEQILLLEAQAVRTKK